MAVTYGAYLKIDELLDLQHPLSEPVEHDEMLFIVIHQVSELWFKQLLHELALLQESLEDDRSSLALGTLKRILAVLKTLVGQMDVLETMTPVAFNAFRHRLDPASGFQSAQFREIEFVLGLKRPERALNYAVGSAERERIEALTLRPSLWVSFLRYLRARGHAVPDEVLERDYAMATEESPEVQETLMEIYRADLLVTQVCESLVDLDEGIQEWRYRHFKIAERTIGAKMGTGGSAGAEYLRQTLFRPLFPDLWAIRSRL